MHVEGRRRRSRTCVARTRAAGVRRCGCELARAGSRHCSRCRSRSPGSTGRFRSGGEPVAARSTAARVAMSAFDHRVVGQHDDPVERVRQFGQHESVDVGRRRAATGRPEILADAAVVDHLDRRAAGAPSPGGPAPGSLRAGRPGRTAPRPRRASHRADQHADGLGTACGDRHDHDGRIRRVSPRRSRRPGPASPIRSATGRRQGMIDARRRRRQRDISAVQLPPQLIDLLCGLTASDRCR